MKRNSFLHSPNSLPEVLGGGEKQTLPTPESSSLCPHVADSMVNLCPSWETDSSSSLMQGPDSWKNNTVLRGTRSAGQATTI